MNTFKTMYCQSTGIRAAQFERVIFLRTCKAHMRPVAWIVVVLFPGVCRRDFDCLARLGQVVTKRELSTDSRLLDHFNRHELPTWRRVFGFRISVRRLLNVSSQLYELSCQRENRKPEDSFPKRGLAHQMLLPSAADTRQ